MIITMMCCNGDDNHIDTDNNSCIKITTNISTGINSNIDNTNINNT